MEVRFISRDTRSSLRPFVAPVLTQDEIQEHLLSRLHTEKRHGTDLLQPVEATGLLQKLGKRLGSLTNKGWSSEKKAKVAEVMRVGYMSSEESDHDPQPPNRTTQYIVRRLPWESNELKKIKKRLDKGHSDSIPDLIKKRTLPRNPGDPSARGKPENCPQWACSPSNTQSSTQSSTQSTMQSSRQASTQSSPQSSPQSSTQSSAQSSPQSSMQSSPQSSMQSSPQSSRQSSQRSSRRQSNYSQSSSQ